MRFPNVGRCRPSLLLPILLFAAIAPAGAQGRRVIDAQLEAMGRQLAADGMSPAFSPVHGSLSDGASARVSRQLVGGTRYVVYGACDGDCSDLDLAVSGPDGRELAADVQEDDAPIVTFTAPASGNFTFTVSMADCDGVCEYGVAFLHSGGSVTVAGRPATATRCTTGSAAGSVRPGQQVSGTLSTSDCVRGDDTYADYHRLTLSSRTPVTITMRSAAFDTYLALANAAGAVVASNDDGAGGTDSRIAETLDAGTYYVIANSLSTGRTGAYTLSVEGASQTEAATATCSGGSAQTTLAPGRTVRGRLTPASCLRSDGSYAIVYRLSIPSRQNVTITMRSGDFDAYLDLQDASGQSIESDDDGAGGTDASISRTLDAGTYYIYANTLSDGETGDFNLEVSGGAAGSASSTGRSESAASSNPRPVCTVGGARESLQVGEVRRGRLDDATCRQRDSNAILYRFAVERTSSITLDLESSTVDAKLEVLSSDGAVVAENDDGGDGTNARLTYQFVPGTYYILVRGVGVVTSGAYTLSAR